MKIGFVQFANSMFPRFDVSDGYWDTFYNTYKDYGYVRMKDAFEVPKWIAEACNFIPSDCEKKIIWVHESVHEAIDEIRDGKYDWILFSVMTCTKGFTERIIAASSHEQKFLIGGYDDWIYECGRCFQNVVVADTMKQTAQALGFDYNAGTDYSLFKGWTVLPRLTLSYGCLNNCKFCIVPHTMSVVDDETIYQQVSSFKDLDFSLIYIDDKTFGQSKNYSMLKNLKNDILKYNSNFRGFVVQTTSFLLRSKAEEFKDIGVVVAEIGVETFNDDILKLYRKPSSEKMVSEAFDAAELAGIKVIPNIIVGFPEETEETYERTERFINDYKDRIFGVNFAMYTDYSSKDCVGEVDFADSPKIELHRKYWARLNNMASKIVFSKNTIAKKPII